MRNKISPVVRNLPKGFSGIESPFESWLFSAGSSSSGVPPRELTVSANSGNLRRQLGAGANQLWET
jgi:hypothetical protein